MKNKLSLIIGIACLAMVTHAQTPLPAQIPVGVTIGQPFQLNGQTFVIETNLFGQYIVITSGPAGSLTNTPPISLQDFITQAQGMIAANNPANKGYYTNELEFQVGAVYVQNTGQAAAKLSIEKWGAFNVVPQEIGFGAALLEGNANGQHGTAGGYAFADYRKIIGDVAGKIGLGGGYDNLNASAMGIVQAEVEYRMSNHIGTYVGVGYALEKKGLTKSSQGGGLIIGGGISYSF